MVEENPVRLQKDKLTIPFKLKWIVNVDVNLILTNHRPGITNKYYLVCER